MRTVNLGYDKTATTTRRPAGGGLVSAGPAMTETAHSSRPASVIDDPPEAQPTVWRNNRDAHGSTGQDSGMHPNVRMVADALLAADAVDGSGEPSTIRILPDAVTTAAAAAAALGIEPGQIANSLIFAADGEPVLIMTSGAHRVDTAKAAQILGVSALKRATADFVREHTGQTIGGVAPLGHPKPIRTLVDIALDGYREIWAAGGIAHSVFPTTYAELVRITGGTPAEVA